MCGGGGGEVVREKGAAGRRPVMLCPVFYRSLSNVRGVQLPVTSLSLRQRSRTE